jgi:hypothetical protein
MFEVADDSQHIQARVVGGDGLRSLPQDGAVDVERHEPAQRVCLKDLAFGPGRVVPREPGALRWRRS